MTEILRDIIMNLPSYIKKYKLGKIPSMERKNHEPLFSVIIPVYNEEKLLKKCLQSVFNQNFPKEKFEVIIVDNNSTDNSLKIALLFPVKITKEKTQGIVAARKKGYRISKGKFIVNLDADCEIPKDWLEKIYQKFKKKKKLVALTGPYHTNGRKKDIFNIFLTKFLVVWENLFGCICTYWGGNFAVKKDALCKIGGYDLRFPNSDQLSLIYRLNRIGKIKLDPKLVVKSSNRRTKNRSLKFVLEIFSYLVDMITVKTLGKHVLIWKNVR